ncbi:response regulator transcription factor [Glaciimonas soli]|uniref:Response regulator n=1 Tax=Glaciimonas soli TaxID=2590999 RepID=A0A843YXV2_9BURK|nr:response regulator transcription factor [Glaciimonas soli]MQR02494.1 response regulator [Glaciimonas soli]
MLRSSENPISIALLDDHEVILHGMRMRFEKESDFRVVGAYLKGRAMISGLQKDPAEVLVLDYSLGPTEIDGINLIQLLKIKYPRCKLLVVSAHDNPATVELIMRSGVQGFVSKVGEVDELVAAVRVVAAGGIYRDKSLDEVSQWVPLPSAGEGAAMADGTAPEWPQKKQLSTREREVLRCCLDGMSVIQIAEKFSKSRKTISTQKQSAMSKLGLSSDNELFSLRRSLEDL